MPDFKAKMHQIWLRLGLCPRPCWTPDPLAQDMRDINQRFTYLPPSWIGRGRGEEKKRKREGKERGERKGWKGTVREGKREGREGEWGDGRGGKGKSASPIPNSWICHCSRDTFGTPYFKCRWHTGTCVSHTELQSFIAADRTISAIVLIVMTLSQWINISSAWTSSQIYLKQHTTWHRFYSVKITSSPWPINPVN